MTCLALSTGEKSSRLSLKKQKRKQHRFFQWWHQPKKLFPRVKVLLPGLIGKNKCMLVTLCIFKINFCLHSKFGYGDKTTQAGLGGVIGLRKQVEAKQGHGIMSTIFFSQAQKTKICLLACVGLTCPPLLLPQNPNAFEIYLTFARYVKNNW